MDVSPDDEPTSGFAMITRPGEKGFILQGHDAICPGQSSPGNGRYSNIPVLLQPPKNPPANLSDRKLMFEISVAFIPYTIKIGATVVRSRDKASQEEYFVLLLHSVFHSILTYVADHLKYDGP